MKATFDMPKLERTLRHFAKDFGEASEQAVIRWSIQVCRELAKESLPFGVDIANNKKTHLDAITRDLGRVVYVDEKRKGKRLLASGGSVIRWLNVNKTGYKNRTKKLRPEKRMICTREAFNEAVGHQMQNIGIAKAGWRGAGEQIGRGQKAGGRAQIGKNFLSYAKKHESRFGSSVKPQPGFTPVAHITNKSSHAAKDYVLKRGAYDKALGFGLKATISWYKHAIKAIDRKKTV